MAGSVVLERRGSVPAANLRIPHHPEVPDEVHQGIVAQHRLARAAERRRLDDETRRLEAFVARARDDRRGMLGPAAHRKLRAFMQKERQRRAKAQLPPVGLRQTPAARRQQTADRRVRFAKAAAGARVVAGDVRAERAATAKRRRAAMAAPIQAQFVGPVKKPEDLQVLNHQPGVLHFGPPFAGVGTWSSPQQVQSDDFVFSGFFVGNDAATGGLGTVNQIEIWDDVDDYELARWTMRSLLPIWMELPPGTEAVNFWVHATPHSVHHAYNLEDEFWGDSNSHVIQSAAFFSEVFGVNGSEQARQWSSSLLGPKNAIDGESEGFEQIEPYMGIGSQWFGWSSAVPPLSPPPNGTSAFAWVGVETHNEIFVDDVVGLSTITSWWVVDEILVQPA
jgi:hypothetical protein